MNQALNNSVIDEAAHWLVRLEEGSLQPAEKRKLDTWRQQSLEHEQAWQAAQKLKGMIGEIPNELGQSTLGRTRLDRRELIKSLGCLLVAAPAGWLAYQHLPWASWSADLRTATGERATHTLPDGSQLQLNTATAVDIEFTDKYRRVQLHQGEIYIATASGQNKEQPPFVVQTEHGLIRALGTRFNVRQTRQPTQLSQVIVYEHAVAIRPLGLNNETRIAAGQQGHFAAGLPPTASPNHQSKPAWLQGQIIANEQTLGEIIHELARYRSGVLRCDPAVAKLPISGVFQTGNTEQALSIIAETLPVSISRISDYWVTVGPAS